MSQKFQCQVCDVQADPEMSFKDAEKISQWTLSRIELPGHTWVNVFTCPECSTMERDEIFAGYSLRIKEGRDLRYH